GQRLHDIQPLTAPVHLPGALRARRPAVQVVEPAALLLRRVRNEQRREELPERGIALSPPALDQLLERFALRLRDESAARERAAQNQISHPLGMSDRVRDRDRAALREPEKAERLDAERVDLFGLSQRSEEHTSELQSRENLECRHLPEKTK